MLAALTLVQVLYYATAMFFHEPSSVVFQGLGYEKDSDFGFAMTYNTKDVYKYLVVGAPKADKIGKVFNCEIEEAINRDNITCEEKIIEPEVEYSTDKYPDQRFHLGSSIVSTSKYIFTCAPLWTTTVKVDDGKGNKVKMTDSFGTCFTQYPEKTKRYNGLLEYYVNITTENVSRKRNFKMQRDSYMSVERCAGGIGWSTLVDEENDLLLIAKSTNAGDFSYVHTSTPDADVKSLLDDHDYTRRVMAMNWNIGFGLTAGKFFSDKTIYAFSMLKQNMEGLISFLEFKKKKFLLYILTNNHSEKLSSGAAIMISSRTVGAMFGNTLGAADLNLDGYDELLVGAPAQSEDECYECGALHIYIGGKDMKTINEPNRIRSIFGTALFGRFGSAIFAKDIDGDGKPELVVSAPYQDHGSGAIYILSGYEIFHTLMEPQEFKSILWSDLKLTQKIQKESYRALGFSLQFVDDVDGNGCDELVAGSPGTSNVLLFKCVRQINVTLTSKLIGEPIVREQDTDFTVEVCAEVEFPLQPDEIIGNVTVANSIIGKEATILNPNIVIDFTCDSCFNRTVKFCENVTVKLNDKEPGRYNFKSSAQLQNKYLSDTTMTVFNKTWVEATPYSKLNTSLYVIRNCKGEDCNPKLSIVDLEWSGSEPYLLGSSANETVKITIQNAGKSSYGACVWFQVYGAPIGQGGCTNYNDGYRCNLPSPMKRDTNYSIDLGLTLTKPKNVQKFVQVQVRLYENCNEESVFQNKTKEIVLDLSSDGVFNIGDSHRLNITDKQILENTTIYDHLEYYIRNNGSIEWNNAEFTVMMAKEPYINSFNISELNCSIIDLKGTSFRLYHCILNVLPNTTHTIIGTTEIFAGRLNDRRNGAEIKINISSTLHLDTRVSNINVTSTTTITIIKEIMLANRKWVIAVIAAIVALILLIILTIVLWKCGFFRRKQKQNLIVAQESVRRKSVRRNTHASAFDGPMEGLQMDVDEDCPFDEARPATSQDNVGLVEDENL